jgi:hypothetical protein
MIEANKKSEVVITSLFYSMSLAASIILQLVACGSLTASR